MLESVYNNLLFVKFSFLEFRLFIELRHNWYMANVLKTIRSGEDYIERLRNRNLKVYLFGELVKEPVDHPIIRPSINAVAETYDLAMREESLASADSSITGLKVCLLYTSPSPRD